MADALFENDRLANLYDPLDPNRNDLDAYVALADEAFVRSVLDIGCGTGTFACRLARAGRDVTAVDPAAASLAVARRKPGADRVRWVVGDARVLPPLRVDLATMTGNVCQVFLDDEDWAATLHAVRGGCGLAACSRSKPATQRARHGGYGPASTRSAASTSLGWAAWRRGST